MDLTSFKYLQSREWNNKSGMKHFQKTFLKFDRLVPRKEKKYLLNRLQGLNNIS